MTWKAEQDKNQELEEKLKERMLIKRRAELGWSSGDDRQISLLNRLIELRVEC